MAIDYERVMWDTTKYVNPQNMNQMDEGIKAACDAVDNMSFDETMTYAEYQALTPEQKADGTTRYIPDYNIGQSVIDNDSTSGTRTWGADKLSSNFSAINSTLPKYKEVRYAALQNSDATKYYITISNNILNDIGDGATKCLSATMSDWTGFGQTVLSLSATRDNALYLLFEKGTTFSSAYIWVKYQYI